jgi:microcystin-dependent protein
MSSPFTGQLSLVGFNFAPYQWALATGQLLPISQNSALFSLLGTNFGGDGTRTFALPNLQGNLAVGQGSAPGLSTYDMGDAGGTQVESLLADQVPPHSHTPMAKTSRTENENPANSAFGDSTGFAYSNATSPSLVSLNAQSLTGFTGSNLAHNNMMPFLAMNWIICLYGIYPPRS